MTGHFEEVGHPVMRGAGPGDDWTWCFVDDAMIRDGATAGWETVRPVRRDGRRSWRPRALERRRDAGRPAEDHVTEYGFPLGDWVAYVREAHRDGSLDPGRRPRSWRRSPAGTGSAPLDLADQPCASHARNTTAAAATMRRTHRSPLGIGVTRLAPGSSRASYAQPRRAPGNRASHAHAGGMASLPPGRCRRPVYTPMTIGRCTTAVLGDHSIRANGSGVPPRRHIELRGLRRPCRDVSQDARRARRGRRTSAPATARWSARSSRARAFPTSMPSGTASCPSPGRGSSPRPSSGTSSAGRRSSSRTATVAAARPDRPARRRTVRHDACRGAFTDDDCGFRARRRAYGSAMLALKERPHGVPRPVLRQPGHFLGQSCG